MSYLRPFKSPRPPTCDALWLRQTIAAKSMRAGGGVRRKTCDLERKIGCRALELEVRRRGFHLIEAGSQFILLCSRQDIGLTC